MATPTANNWKRAILDVPPDAGDRGVTTLHDLLSDPDERANINELRGEDETVFLAAHPEGTVAFLHHLRVVGGTRLRPDQTLQILCTTRAQPPNNRHSLASHNGRTPSEAAQMPAFNLFT